MKNFFHRIISYSVLLYTVLGSGLLFSRVIDSPLTLRDGYLHCPLTHQPDEELSCLQTGVWAAGYSRTADLAYAGSDECKKSLATLFFGAQTFSVANAFGNQLVPTIPNFIINVTSLTPDIDFNERGAYFGAKVAGRFGKKNKWASGLRGSIPFNQLEVINNGLHLKGDLSDVRSIITEQIPVSTTTITGSNTSTTSSESTGNATVTNSYAYRLDLLSVLPLVACSNEPLVNFSAVPLTIANTTVAGSTNGATDFTYQGPNAPGVNVIRPASNSGIIQSPSCISIGGATAGNFALDRVAASKAQKLPANGIINPGERATFDATTNYSALGSDLAALQSLYLTRTVTEKILNQNGVTNVPAGTTDSSNIAQNIYTQVEGVFPLLNASIDPFISASQLDFSSYKKAGPGDAYLEYFVGYDFSEKLWNEAAFGVLFPTGKKHNYPYKVYGLPLGNNGHYEIRLRDIFEYDPCHYFKCKADISYNWALKKKEALAPQFIGATVINLPVGQPVCADVSWSYFWGRLDCTFIEPYTCAGGVDLGYEVYVKTKDHIRYTQKSAETIFGATQELDPTLLEKLSKARAHKVRVEFFHGKEAFSMYAGWLYTFAGKYTPRDTDFYLGFNCEY